MENELTNQNEYDYIRKDYYYGMLEDSRNVFIDYGRHLQKSNIKGYGTIDDYETFLNLQETQEEELKIDNDEYLEFISFLLEQESWQRDIIVIRGEDWDEFYSTDDEDYEMKLEHCDAKSFYKKFAEITKTNIKEFEANFISSKYIDTYTYNTINLIIKINETNQRFVIDAV